MSKQDNLWGKSAENWVYIQEPQHNPLFEAMLNAVTVGSETRFLDLGCGGGTSSVLAEQRGAQITGLDLTEEFIDIARDRLPASDFHVGTMESLPFDDKQFDVVYAANSIQFPPNRNAVMNEIKRVCAPEGRIVAGLFGVPEKVAFSKVQGAIRNVLPSPPSPSPFPDLRMDGALEDLFESSGLKVLESKEVNCPFVYPDFETLWRGISAAGPTQGAIRAVGEEKIQAVMRETLEPFRIDGGGYNIAPNTFKYIVASL